MNDAQPAAVLQLALSDLINLHLLGKQAHWNVHGTHFRSVHLHLDEVVELTRVAADDVAERIAAIGGSPDGRPGFVAKSTHLNDFGPGPLGDDKVTRLFAELLDAAAKHILTHVHELDDDLLSQDLVIGIARDLEKQAWMFRAGEK